MPRLAPKARTLSVVRRVLFGDILTPFETETRLSPPPDGYTILEKIESTLK
jgi:hypothetical protein